MRVMKPALYERVHKIRAGCLAREYPMFNAYEVKRDYADTRASVEKNTSCRDMRTINVTTAIEKSRLEEKIMDLSYISS